MFRFRCECGRELQAETGQMGLLARCPACRRPVTVPSPDAPLAGASGHGGNNGIVTSQTSPSHAEDQPSPRAAANPFALSDDWAARCDAEAALVLGLLGLVICVFSFFALYCGVQALRRMRELDRRDGEEHPYRWVAIVGIALSAVTLLAQAAILALVVLLNR